MNVTFDYWVVSGQSGKYIFKPCNLDRLSLIVNIKKTVGETVGLVKRLSLIVNIKKWALVLWIGEFNIYASY